MKNSFKESLKAIRSYFLDENIPMEAKKFYLVLLYICPVVLIVCILNPILHLSYMITLMILFYMIVTLTFTYIVWRFREFKRMSIIFCLFSSVVVFPLLFCLSGDIYASIPMFLTASVILSFFLIDGAAMWGVVGFQYAFYCFMFWFCYLNQEHLDELKLIDENFCMRILNFIFACLIPVLIIFYQNMIYNRIKEKIAQSYISIHNAEMRELRFLANMTHEIRTPTNAIVGMNELILKEDLTEGAREQAEVIKDASEHLLKIVNNILIYSKLDSGKWKPVMTKFSFRDLMQDVVNSVSRGMQEDGSDFFVYIDRSIPKYLYGDESGIKQVFMYLLFNSVQQKNRRSMTLEVKSERLFENHSVKIKCRIAETGKGLPEADVDSILGAYQKYDSRRNATLKGMGLEISICKELLANMDGYLKIESVIGVGTAIVFEFTNYIIDDTPMIELGEIERRHVLVYLHDKDEEGVWKALMEDILVNPMYVAGPIAFKTELENCRYSHIFVWERDYELLSRILSEAHCEENTYIVTDFKHSYNDFGACRLVRKPISCLNIIDVLNDKWDPDKFKRNDDNQHIIFPDAKVLVVDDSIVNQKVLCGTLENFKVSADTASSGSECLELLKNNHYDLIMLDQVMTGMDGFETLHQIKQLGGRIATIPILCITAEIGRDVHERLIEQGFEDYIAKPIKDYHLARLLKQYLPDEMAVIAVGAAPVEVENEKTPEAVVTEEEQMNPLEIDISRGIQNVGGSEEIYATVLNTYYHEGVSKWTDIPTYSMDTNLSLFTTNVHALKSSSASIGAMDMSELFKRLEFAGKENNRAYIEENLSFALENFRELLEKVKSFLEERNAFEDPSDLFGNAVSNLEEEELNQEDVLELQQCMNNVNLKRCEEIIEMLSGKNYGTNNNRLILDMKNAYDMFDYSKVKKVIAELIK